MRVSRRTLIFSTALAGVIAFVALDLGKDGGSSNSTPPSSARTIGDSKTATGPRGEAAGRPTTLFTFRERPPFGEPQGTLFGSHEWQSSSRNTAAVAVVAPPPPVAPPMPYTFSGALVFEGQLQIFLAKGDSIISVGLGETIEGGYRVDAIDERQITLTYLPLEQKQVIPVSTSVSFAGVLTPTAADKAASRMGAGSGNLAGAGLVLVLDERQQNKTAQLIWQGPQQVKLGTQFSVVLRVTSAQPVRASPMQIKVNSELFEMVSVKPGQFFENRERNFNYRIDPGGSIFVGASTPNPVPASDAELVVLTLKPLKLAPAAELAIASVSLHGPAGQVIPFDAPPAFRTAITN